MFSRALYLAAALLPANAALAEGLEKLPYTGFQAAYVQIDIDDLDVDASGPALNGFFEVGANVFLTASYSTAKSEDFTIFGLRGGLKGTNITLGAGYHYALSSQVDLVPQLAVLDAKTEATGDFAGVIEDEDDTGWTAGLGVRALLTPYFEVSGGATYVDIYDDSDTSYSVEAFFYPMKRFGAGVGYSVADDTKSVMIGGRIVF